MPQVIERCPSTYGTVSAVVPVGLVNISALEQDMSELMHSV
jgi:hypothetical protein